MGGKCYLRLCEEMLDSCWRDCERKKNIWPEVLGGTMGEKKCYGIDLRNLKPCVE